MFKIFKYLLLEMRKYRYSELKISTVLVISAAFAELISIGMVFPLISVFDLASHGASPYSSFESFIRDHMSLDSKLLIFCIFVISFGFASIVRCLTIFFTAKLSYGLATDISLKIYRNILLKPFSHHISSNSSEVLNTIVKKAGQFSSFFQAVVNLLSYSFILLVIFSFLIYLKPIPTIFVCTFFGGFYFFVILLTKKIINEDSIEIVKESGNLIKLVQESMGGIRDIIIDKTHDFFINQYHSSDKKMRNAQVRNILIMSFPKILIEFFGVVLIVGYIAISIWMGNTVTATLPDILLFLVATQRMMPAVSQIYSATTAIRAGYKSIIDVFELCQEMPVLRGEKSPITFSREIYFSHVFFRYSENDRDVLKDLCLRIGHGKKIGIIGESGCGKSTLIDLLMGVLTPTGGEILVDNVRVDLDNSNSWHEIIAHVPQDIYISDQTIYENVAFGIPLELINKSAVERACKKSLIDKFIRTLPKGYMTKIGERGGYLSGGQIQRIAIARALYKKAPLLILDEFTSALDQATEMELIQLISKFDQNMTLVVVSHRLTTLSICDEIYRLTRAGRLSRASIKK